MRRTLRRLWRDERGVSLAIVALMMTTLLSLLAFSLDLGLLYTARAEAQRAADAAALAGASAYLNPGADPEARAVDYATANDIRGQPIKADEVTVGHPGPRSVTVTIRRNAVPLWFARMFGIATRPVTASATAGAVNADNAECVAPIAFRESEIIQSIDEFLDSVHGDVFTIGPLDSDADYEYTEVVHNSYWTNWGTDPDGCHSDRIYTGDGFDLPYTSDPYDGWVEKLLEDDTPWNEIEGRYGPDSPRTITVMLYEPDVVMPEEKIQVTDFLLFRVEGMGADGGVLGRFLAYATGAEPGDSRMTRTVRLTQ